MNENVYYCDYRNRGCEYTSTIRSNATKHSKNSCMFRTNTERQEVMNYCDECNYVSANPESFRRHARNCLGVEQPRFQCDECNQLFVSQQKLRNHKRSKHYWQCQLCTRRIADIYVSIFRELTKNHSLGIWNFKL